MPGLNLSFSQIFEKNTVYELCQQILANSCRYVKKDEIPKDEFDRLLEKATKISQNTGKDTEETLKQLLQDECLEFQPFFGDIKNKKIIRFIREILSELGEIKNFIRF